MFTRLLVYLFTLRRRRFRWRWGLCLCRRWRLSRRACERRGDGGCVAGCGGRCKSHWWQVDLSHRSEPEQLTIDPSSFVLSQRCILLVGRDLQPGRLLVAGTEEKTGAHQQRFPHWRVDRARPRAHIDGIGIIRLDAKTEPVQRSVCWRKGQRWVLGGGQSQGG